jgi:hypothetical protein
MAKAAPDLIRALGKQDSDGEILLSDREKETANLSERKNRDHLLIQFHPRTMGAEPDFLKKEKSRRKGVFILRRKKK